MRLGELLADGDSKGFPAAQQATVIRGSSFARKSRPAVSAQRYGLCRHRALLFKLCCERLDIVPCQARALALVLPSSRLQPLLALEEVDARSLSSRGTFFAALCSSQGSSPNLFSLLYQPKYTSEHRKSYSKNRLRVETFYVLVSE